MLVISSLMAFAAAVPAQTVLTVDDTGDGSDANPGINGCDDGSGNCTLRAAIEEANASSASEIEIRFSLGGAPPYTIEAHSDSLHIQRDNVLIDGTSQSTAPNPEIEIRGTQTSIHDGFHIEGSGNEIRGLSIIGFRGDGIFVDGNLNVIVENLIGVDTAGAPAGNNDNGITVNAGSSFNRIGDAGQGNVISDNSNRGIYIGAGGAADTNWVQGNIIGADPSGSTLMGNSMEGILIFQSDEMIIGGDRTQGLGNLVVDNGRRGIFATSSDETTIRGNLVGINADGDAMGNTGPGIELNRGSLNQIGQAPPEETGNVVADNDGAGILIENTDSTGNIIAANEIGGISVSGGPLIIHANHGSGVVDFGDKTTIGGNGSEDRNQLWNQGITLHGTNGSVRNNSITACDGTGIRVTGSEYVIGGASIPTQNAITACEGPAITIEGSAAISNRIERNHMQNNGGPGIDLGADGIDNNDADDGDSGPNNRQNSPDLIAADYIHTQDELTVTFRVDSTTANSAYDLRVDFYRDSSTTPEPQSLAWLGSTLYSSGDAQSEVTVTVSGLPTYHREGEVIATATDSDGNTSEFSNALRYGGVFDDRFEMD